LLPKQQFLRKECAPVNIVICEDTEKDARALRLLIEKYFLEINCLGKIMLYESGDAFLDDFAADKINDVKIVFLDIFMPGTNGIDTARKLRETDKKMVVIITTTSKNHGLEGYSVDALQYLVKPVNYPELKSVLEKCAEKFADSLRFIEVLSDRLTVRIYLKDIMYIESFNTALHIHTVKDTIKTFLPISEIEKQLENSAFLRTHRSFIVNIPYIKDVAENDFILTDGALVPIRQNDKLAVKQAYMDYVFAYTRGGRV